MGSPAAKFRPTRLPGFSSLQEYGRWYTGTTNRELCWVMRSTSMRGGVLRPLKSFRAAPVKEWSRHRGVTTSRQVQQRLALEEGLGTSEGNRTVQAKSEKHPREMHRCLRNLLMFTRGSFSKTGSGRNRRCRARGKGYASRSTTVCKKLKTCAAMHNARPHVSPRSRAWQRAEPKALSKGRCTPASANAPWCPYKGPGVYSPRPLARLWDTLPLIKRL